MNSEVMIMKNVRFDFVIHWLFAIVWALLGVSGFSMVSAKFGWILNFNFVTADIVHRINAAAFVFITFISVIYEIIRKVKKDDRKQPWFIIGRSGYQLFTLIISMLLIVSGAVIWICMEVDKKDVAFALLVHEYISYVALASVVWHIFIKTHILAWPQKKTKK
jgi:Cytochrome b subunit of formate dehydrogenase